MTDEALSRHEIEMHPQGYTAEELAAMIAEFGEIKELLPGISENVGYMVDDLYGERHPLPGKPDNREGGRLDALEETQHQQATRTNEMYKVFTNGGVRIRLTAPVWAFLGIVVIALSGIIVALITGSPSP